MDIPVSAHAERQGMNITEHSLMAMQREDKGPFTPEIIVQGYDMPASPAVNPLPTSKVRDWNEVPLPSPRLLFHVTYYCK